MGELRERKKRETKDKISNIATRLFYERGFEAVTIEEIAAAADVSKVTVFNYFVRKEDLLLDRQAEVKPLLRAALSPKRRGPAAIDALRALVERLAEQKHPFARVDKQTVAFFRVVGASASLKARLREFEDEAAAALAAELAEREPDAEQRLVAAMLVLTWRTAYAEAIGVLERGGSAKKANAAFLALIDRGFAAARYLAAPAKAAATRAE